MTTNSLRKAQENLTVWGVDALVVTAPQDLLYLTNLTL